MTSVPIRIVVPNIADVLKYFDSVEVQKSVAGTPFSDAVPLTAISARGASLTGTGTVFTHLAGTALNLDVSGVGVSHAFIGPNPMTMANVLRELRSLELVNTVSSSGRLKLTTEGLGLSTRLSILDGTANTILGFSSGQTTFGLDPDIDLLAEIGRYTFLDRTSPYQNGWYRMRYVNSSTGRTDAWQDWFLGPGTTAVNPESLILGTLKLATLDGKVAEGSEITVVNCFSPLVQDSYFIAGASLTQKTDSAGQTSFTLVRGALVDVIVEGTSIIRRIQVPVTGESFDLLDANLQVDDLFGIQQPDLPAAVRHS